MSEQTANYLPLIGRIPAGWLTDQSVELLVALTINPNTGTVVYSHAAIRLPDMTSWSVPIPLEVTP